MEISGKRLAEGFGCPVPYGCPRDSHSDLNPSFVLAAEPGQCISDAHRVSHVGVEILAWEIEILSWHCQLLGTAAQSLSETLLAAALLKGTSFPGRVLAESLAGEPVPLRSINASKGHQRSIAASRNISPRERCLHRDTNPGGVCKGQRSLRVPSAPV